MEGGGLGGDEQKDELLFDLNADLEADDVAGLGPGIPRHSNYRPRFPPC